ncbi:MAG: glycosyltransferase family 1 protein [Alphaproteobacteria bacterium]
MRILVVTDAWHPQVNGVVRTLTNICREASRLGFDIDLVTPQSFQTVPCPSYPEIRLAINPTFGIASRIERFWPDAVHIATEGSLGLAARRYCLKSGLPFTTSFHTRFPEYLKLRTGLPLDWSYAALRRFHEPARCTMVPTESLKDELTARGFRNLAVWGHGVDIELFRPRPKDESGDRRPVYLAVGRVAVEKNLTAFLDLDLIGTKQVVGDGPLLEKFRRAYPQAQFLGTKFDHELARIYAGADVLVFPSLTDTFGNVILEALASGVPVAAYPVTGPKDILAGTGAGVLDQDLGAAARNALGIAPEICRAVALRRSWRASTEQFLDNLTPIERWRSLVPLCAGSDHLERVPA